MTQQVNHRSNHALGSKLWALEFPQSLGTFPEYEQVQKMVDTLADNDFPVQHTLIVGTDLKLMERVTGKKSWSRIILSGLLSGAWLGLFIGLLIGLFSENWLATLVQSVLMGTVFFTVWAVVGHAFSKGQRDFTSLTTTVPMHYELLVEHRYVAKAQQILREARLPLGPGAYGSPVQQNLYGSQQFNSGQGQVNSSNPQAANGFGATDEEIRRPQYGQPASSESNSAVESDDHRGPSQYGRPS